MPIVMDALGANRAAVESFLEHAEEAAPRWSVPRAPGKWSPAQVLEHVARGYDESAKMLAGKQAAFPTLPGLIRPLARRLVFTRAVNGRGFPKAKTNKPMDPETGPATPAEGRARLQAAVDAFEQQVRAMGSSGDVPVVSGTFGTVSLSEWVLFQEAHAKHHAKQLKAAT